MTEFTFLQPFWLMLMPVVFVWFRYQVKNLSELPQFIEAIVIRYPPLQQSGAIQNKQAVGTNISKQLLLILLLFSVALAQPVTLTINNKAQNQYEPVDLILLVNTSVSMVIKDYEVNGLATSRLSLAKTLLTDFINQYTGQKMALVMHSNPPMVWLPLTNDKQAVQHAIQRISPEIGGRLSNLGASFDLVAKTFVKTNDADKVVLLIADGSLQVGGKSPVIAAKELAEKGFFVYIIAMGKQTEANESNKSINLLFEPVNLASLQKITQSGKGQLFHAITQKSFDDALRVIELKHKKKINNNATTKTITPWYPTILWLALLSFIFVFRPRVKL